MEGDKNGSILNLMVEWKTKILGTLVHPWHFVD